MIAAAMILDAVLGEPPALWHRLPHPVVLFGRIIAKLEAWLNRGRLRRLRGLLGLGLLLIAVGLPAWGLAAIPHVGPVLEVIGAAILIAQRSLLDHVRAVADGLARSLAHGRKAVSMIVGRDPERLDKAGVARAAIESAAENFSDGVAAPIFWFAVAGLPGIVLYKAINTADSMIGHRSDRYLHYGWAAARLDDVANLVPARLAGLLLCAVGGGRTALRVMLRDAPGHRSPNAGWPEAAMAASLGVRLAGPRIYGGALTDDPWINGGGRAATAADIGAACALLWRAWAVMLAVALAIALLMHV